MLPQPVLNAVLRLTADKVISDYLRDGYFNKWAIRTILMLATHNDDRVAAFATSCFFSRLVERLADSFNPTLEELYDRVIAEAIFFCRGRPGGSAIDEGLRRANLEDAEHILHQKELQGRKKDFLESDLDRIQKCLILSRVTLGAEVAISSQLVVKALEVCPKAEIVLIGSEQLSALFSGIRRFRVRAFDYPRVGFLMQRLNASVDAMETVQSEVNGSDQEATLILDPDSRLSQGGMFPLVNETSRILFFPSREINHPELPTLGELTRHWLRQTFGGAETAPSIFLSDRAYRFARAVKRKFAARNRVLIGVSYGVGGNSRKRAGFDFELRLLRMLLDVPNASVLLFEGASPAERTRSQRLISAVQQHRAWNIARYRDENWTKLPPGDADLIGWIGELETYCSLLDACSLHIGYDSSGQHIAVALGTPSIDIFIRPPSPKFVERWTAFGHAPCTVVQADGSKDFDKTFLEIKEAVHSFRFNFRGF